MNKERILKITHLKTNHVKNPLGFAIDKPVYLWTVEDTQDKEKISVQVLMPKDDTFKHNIFGTNFS
jgi:alpha-L-rhamnosidase